LNLERERKRERERERERRWTEEVERRKVTKKKKIEQFLDKKSVLHVGH